MPTGIAARLAAACVALTTWVGLGLLLNDEMRRSSSGVSAALWHNARFFTDISNLLIAIVFSMLALAPTSVGPRLFGVPLVSTIMATVVFFGLLGGASTFAGGSAGNAVAHALVPALVAIYWLAPTPGSKFARTDVGWWALFPLAYCAYAIARGLSGGGYPYFFLNVGTQGAAVAGWIAAILFLFILIALAVVAIDARLPRNRAGT